VRNRPPRQMVWCNGVPNVSRIALLADIHGNSRALQAVLADVDDQGVDAIVCLGDVVGYGPEPGECLDLVAGLCDVLIRGNHDEAVLCRNARQDFNPRALEAMERSIGGLTVEHRRLLGLMQDRAAIGAVQFTHGSFGPYRYEYLYGPAEAARSMSGMELEFGAVGHTHVPSVFVQRFDENGTPRVSAHHVPSGQVEIPEASRVLVNPGSVGQPRDRNPDASWGLLDAERRTFEVRRVAYDVDMVRRRIEELGLPEHTGLRLAAGV